ncbi:MAG: hypothetical protein DRP18_04340 [Candidatus Aenigmatarchaeota archaeon]|nr:MAG: hypothetical protein DRP18_04340 [Candidatus Aenigmarchaeota archaeon]
MGVKRVKTGIEGFDKLVQGGFPEGSCVLLAGTPGTGKTIFSLEYLYNGALKFKEKGLYISVGQPVDSLIEQAKLFGWDIEKLINNGMLEIIYISTKELDQNISQFIVDKIQQNNIKRAVIDSISVLATNAPVYKSLNEISVVDILEHRSFFSPPILGDSIIKKFIYTFIENLRTADSCTTILISEASEKGEFICRDTVSEFACDGIIIMGLMSIGNENYRSIQIRKMRLTDQGKDIYPLEITKNGIVVKTKSL